MDPVTHALTGALIAEAGITQRLGWKARPAMVLAAMFPDIDIVYRLRGLTTYLANHRALTHSFAGLIASGILLGSITARIDQQRRYLAWIAALWIALFSHVLLDLITSYGTQILYPFSRERFYYDWVFIVDFFLTGILLLFVIVAYVKPQNSEHRARVGLLLAAGYIAFCAFNHEAALTRLRDAARQNQISYQSLAAIPQPLSPFVWSGIIDSENEYFQTTFLSWRVPQPPFAEFKKTTGSFFEERARQSDYGALYYWFARYPVVNEKTVAREHIIEFSDLRFYIHVRHLPARKPFVLRIIVDDSGKILESGFEPS